MLASRHYIIQFLPALSRLSLLALTRAILQDKLFCAARSDEANTRVMRMTDPWWVAGMHFDKMLKKHEQLVQVSFILTIKSIVDPLPMHISGCDNLGSQTQRSYCSFHAGSKRL